RISQIFNDKGEVINYISIREDITESIKARNDLLEAKEKAEEANRIKSIFLANMSHELRTPMVGIIGFTEILEGEIENPELKEYATFIHEGANRLMESLNLILNLTKIEAEKISIDLSLIDVIKNIKKDVSTFDKIADKKNIYLKFESGIEQFETETDERMFDQIICNLVNNAVKFTEAGGVTVSVDKVKNNSYLKIKVKDTGIGIPKDKQEIIWEEFRQVSEGTSRKYEGTGLGLTITNNFVNQLGGEIKLESELGEGSTFIVLLPIH
ncbi:MAG: hybrid sensor histidine kinase/response regulator, partial [Bacteroidetes bacterium]|nr:hybrid sensor histidine kinase/response regulator [Bacteroidota bacterium]